MRPKCAPVTTQRSLASRQQIFPLNFGARFLRLSLAALLLVSSGPSLAAVYSLFDAEGRQSATYDSDIEKITTGDTLDFTDGNSFRIAGILGQGSVTKVFALSPRHPIERHLSNRMRRNVSTNGCGLKADAFAPLLSQRTR
jgi:hypothetical protein